MLEFAMISIFDHILELVAVFAIVSGIAITCLSVLAILIIAVVFLINIVRPRSFFYHRYPDHHNFQEHADVRLDDESYEDCLNELQNQTDGPGNDRAETEV